MNNSYVAGMFDGEGSAMVITVKRKRLFGIFYNFIPIIKIAQKNREALDKIKEHLKFGNVCNDKHVHNYKAVGSENVIKFVNLISPHCIIKKKPLLLLKTISILQTNRPRNSPYNPDEFIEIIELRDCVYRENLKTRTGLKQKYSKEQILDDYKKIDIRKWHKNRCKNSIKGLIKYAKSRKIERTFINCVCGCGEKILNYSNGKYRKYKIGHSQRGKTWAKLK